MTQTKIHFLWGVMLIYAFKMRKYDIFYPSKGSWITSHNFSTLSFRYFCVVIFALQNPCWNFWDKHWMLIMIFYITMISQRTQGCLQGMICPPISYSKISHRTVRTLFPTTIQMGEHFTSRTLQNNEILWQINFYKFEEQTTWF